MISVCIPVSREYEDQVRDPNADERSRNLALVATSYERQGYEVVYGFGDWRAWRKGVAVRDAVSRASSDDLLVIADGDVWSDHLPEAIHAVRERAAEWATPHWQVRRLTRHATDQAWARYRLEDGVLNDLETEEEHHGLAGGGIVVLHRDLYEQVPIDERFVGWGGEDKAWAYALRTLAGRPYRVQQPLWHFWHPPQARLTRAIGSEANDALRARYADAVRQPKLMRALIAEGRAWASSGSSSKT